jgi:DNA-binding Lrp family transcriptional regulator
LTFISCFVLEQLIGSKTRVKLLRLFYGSPGTAFYVREIARAINSQIHAVRRELDNLQQLGIIRESTADENNSGDVSKARARMRKYFQLDQDFFLLSELRALVLKSQFLLEHELKRRVRQLGTIRYFALLGMFIGDEESPVDAVVVGSVRTDRLARVMRRFERDLSRPINYVVFSVRDFTVRCDAGDRFLYDLLEKKCIVVIDELTPAAREAKA